MAITKRFPADYVNLIRGLNITPDYRAIQREYYGEGVEESRYFKPSNEVGELSYRVLRLIQSNEIKTNTRGLVKGTLGDLAVNTDVLKEYPEMKVYFQMLLLDVMSIEIAIEHKIEMREHMFTKDIENTRENILYVSDIIGVDPRYVELRIMLQELYVDLGYIQAQIPVIKRDMREGLDG